MRGEPMRCQQGAKAAAARLQYSVRRPEPAHYEGMAVLAGQLGYPSTSDQIRIRVEEMSDPEQFAIYVAQRSGGQVAGWISAYIFQTVELDRLAEVSGLVVDEKVRSRGIGKALLNAIEQWARVRGCSVVSVRSNVHRDRAHLFYTNNGYEHVKTQKQFHKRL